MRKLKRTTTTITNTNDKVLLVDSNGDAHVRQGSSRAAFVVMLNGGTERVLEQLGQNVLERERQISKLRVRVSIYLKSIVRANKSDKSYFK